MSHAQKVIAGVVLLPVSLNSGVGWGTGPAAPRWGLSPIGWSERIEKRLPADSYSAKIS